MSKKIKVVLFVGVFLFSAVSAYIAHLYFDLFRFNPQAYSIHFNWGMEKLQNGEYEKSISNFDYAIYVARHSRNHSGSAKIARELFKETFKLIRDHDEKNSEMMMTFLSEKFPEHSYLFVMEIYNNYLHHREDLDMEMSLIEPHDIDSLSPHFYKFIRSANFFPNMDLDEITVYIYDHFPEKLRHSPVILSNHAVYLTTCKNEKYRDPKRALKMIEPYLDKTDCPLEYRISKASALACLGDFQAAMEALSEVEKNPMFNQIFYMQVRRRKEKFKENQVYIIQFDPWQERIFE